MAPFLRVPAPAALLQAGAVPAGTHSMGEEQPSSGTCHTYLHPKMVAQETL